MSGLSAQSPELSTSGDLLDGIAAIVNDGVVLKSELQVEMIRIVERLNAQGTPVPPTSQLTPQILERLIINQIQLQRADRIGIQISDETLNLALANIAERNGVSLSDLPNALASEGVNYNSFRNEMREQLTIEQLRQRDVIARINVNPRELEEYIAQQEGRATSNVEFKLSHILISTSVNHSLPRATTEVKKPCDSDMQQDFLPRLLGGTIILPTVFF